METRSEFKVTFTQGWYATLCHPKMHAHVFKPKMRFKVILMSCDKWNLTFVLLYN